MSPVIGRLYEYAKEHMPDVYESLRDLDTGLAELHASGAVLQRTRTHMLQEIAKSASVLNFTSVEMREVSTL
jgi:hypothetical protein